MDVSQVADELYGLPPEEFITARNTRAAGVGDKELAKAIKELRKPTTAAWAVNLLRRDNPAELEEALSLHSGHLNLRELGRRRKALTDALTRRTLELTGPLADDVVQQVRNTLGAAMAEPDLAEQVRGGRLTKSLDYSGFGAAEVFAPAAAPVEDALARKRQERRERKLTEARDVLAETREQLHEAQSEEASARRTYERAAERMEEARRHLKAAEKANAAAQRKLDDLEAES